MSNFDNLFNELYDFACGETLSKTVREKIEKQGYKWVLQVYDDGKCGDDQRYVGCIFATEEEAMNRLKEIYESALKERNIKASFNEERRAAFFTTYYHKRVENNMSIYVVKEKINLMDMTVSEFYDKISFDYGSENVDFDCYITSGFLSNLTEEDWVFTSPYSRFKLRLYRYGSHEYDCCYHIIGEYGSELFNRGIEFYRDDKMTTVLEKIKKEDDAYYTTFLSNVRKITDAGGEYVLDMRRQDYECRYMLRKKDEFSVRIGEDSRIYITAKVKE